MGDVVRMEHLAINELQQLGRVGDEAALLELGRKVLDMDFCFGDKEYCESRHELAEMELNRIFTQTSSMSSMKTTCRS